MEIDGREFEYEGFVVVVSACYPVTTFKLATYEIFLFKRGKTHSIGIPVRKGFRPGIDDDNPLTTALDAGETKAKEMIDKILKEEPDK